MFRKWKNKCFSVWEHRTHLSTFHDKHIHSVYPKYTEHKAETHPEWGFQSICKPPFTHTFTTRGNLVWPVGLLAYFCTVGGNRRRKPTQTREDHTKSSNPRPWRMQCFPLHYCAVLFYIHLILIQYFTFLEAHLVPKTHGCHLSDKFFFFPYILLQIQLLGFGLFSLGRQWKSAQNLFSYKI